MNKNFFETLTIILFFFLMTSVNSATLVQGDNTVGLYGINLQQLNSDVTSDSPESYLNCEIYPSEKGTHYLDCKWDKEFYIDATTMNLGQFKKKYSNLDKYFPKNSDFVKWVKYIQTDGLPVTENGTATKKDNVILKGDKFSTELKLKPNKNNSIKIGDNSIEFYFDNGEVNVVVTPETTTSCQKIESSDSFICDATFELNNTANANQQIDVSLENFYADMYAEGSAELYYWYEWEEEVDYNYPIWNNKLLIITDYNTGTETRKDGEWRKVKPFANTVELPNGSTQTYFNQEAWVSINGQTTQRFKYVIVTPESQGKYDLYFFYDGQTYLIDPYWSASVSQNDLNNNFFKGQYVKNSPQLLANSWTATGQLDWNIESVNTTTSGGWGQLGIDFNIIDDSNVVASYNFNGNVNDFFGNYNLTCSGTEDYSTGLWATQGGEFDNATYCKTSYTYTSTEYAIGGWFKTTATGTHGLISTRDPFSPYKGFGIDMRAKAGKEGTLFFGQKDATYDESINPDIVVNDGRWHHVVGQFTGTKMQLFIDGKLAGEYSTTSVINKGSEIFIGRLYRTTNNYYWDGQIEDAFFYAQAMTEEQVSEMYLEQKGSWLDENLIAYYKFNESSGTTVFDSARGHNGTLVGGADIGERGMWDTNSLYLDGTGDYVTAGYNSLILNPDDSFSASAWVKRTYNKTGFIITDENSSYYGWRLYYNSFNASLAFLFQRPSGYSLASASFPYDNEWHHVAFTYGGCENFYTCLNIYIDGEEESNVTAGSSFSGERYQSDFSIGRVGYSSSDTFQGNIDEVKLWREELTEEEIIADYNLFLENKFVDVNIVDATGTTDWNSIRINKDINYNFGRELTLNEGYFTDLNLIGLWHLNNNATDATGNNNSTTNGITYDTGLWGTDSATFDNSTDYINVGSDYLVFGNPAFTINTWVKPNTFTGANQYIYGEAVNIGNIVNLSLSDQNYFRFGYRGTINWSYINFGGSPIDLDKWYMVTVAYTPSTGTGKVYLNGVDSTNQTATYSGSLSGYSFLRNTIGNSPYHLNTYNFNGQIEETAIWDRVLSEQEITDLYRKYATKIDLNVYSCSDANCSTITDTEYINDANNNEWMGISSLTASRYLGYNAYFKPISELVGYDGGRFFVNSFLQDVNISFGGVPDINYWDLNLYVYETGTSTNLTNVTIDSNNNTLDATGDSPFIYTNVQQQSLSITANKLGFDSNTINFVLDSNQEQTIYLNQKFIDKNIILKNSLTDTEITDGNFVLDFNLSISGYDYDTSGTPPFDLNMQEGYYSLNVSNPDGNYDVNNGIIVDVLADGNFIVYVTPILSITVDWITPPYQGTTSSLHTYFIVTANANPINDLNLTLNGSTDYNMFEFCTGWGTLTVTCNTTSILFIPMNYNDLNIWDEAEITYGDNNFYYDPNKDNVIPNNNNLLWIILVLLVALFVRQKK